MNSSTDSATNKPNYAVKEVELIMGAGSIQARIFG